MATASTFRFDGSDLMPGKIGAGAFWTGMVDFVGGKSSADIAGEIQKSLGRHQVGSRWSIGYLAIRRSTTSAESARGFRIAEPAEC